MRVLVTGAAGFLGSHLCDRLLVEGHRVVGMDNFLTGNPANIAHLRKHPSFQFVLHDVANFVEVQGPLDGVLHFASPASPVDYLDYPIQTLKVGSLGTHKALGLSRAKGARFLLASDRKSTRLNSSHRCISYAVFCLKKKKTNTHRSSHHKYTHHT